MRFLILLASACLALAAAASAEKKIVCYVATWATYRAGAGKFDVEDIDANLCTHVIYTFVGLGNDNRVKSLDERNDYPTGVGEGGKNGFARFNALRQRNPALKTLVAFGGWNEGSQRYSIMAANPKARATFVASVVAFVKKHKFNGFDVDWEYPAQRGGKREDRANFISLLKELRAAFDKEGGFLLSAAVGAGEGIAAQSYNIAEMNKYLDFINVMTYDFYTAGGGVAGMNAGLYGGKSSTIDDKKNNVHAAIQYWLSKGASRDKLILGTPMYGHAFTLGNSGKTSPGSITTGPGTPGPYTKEAGMLGYNEICEELKKGGWQVKYDEDRRVPYAYRGNQWISYDDIQSIKEKAQYAMKEGLGGAMIWSIETDDFRGKCGEKYPLLKTINHVLRNTKAVANDKLFPISAGSGSSDNADDEIVEDVDISGECKQEGLIAHPSEQTHFIQCKADGNGGYVAFDMQCPAGLIWDTKVSVCNWNPENQSVEREPMSLSMAPSSSILVENMPSERADDEISEDVEAEIPGECETEGPIAHPAEPTHFIVCKADGHGGYIKYDMNCPSDLIWDAEISACNWNREI